MLCPYKNLFGVPREGLHAYRIPYLDIAAFDTLGVLLVGFLISRYFKINFFLVVIILFLVGFLSHKLFCVKEVL